MSIFLKPLSPLDGVYLFQSITIIIIEPPENLPTFADISDEKLDFFLPLKKCQIARKYRNEQILGPAPIIRKITLS